jgi:exodeoxyribonuclease VII large subunit
VRLRTCAQHVALGTRHGLAAADAVLTSATQRLSRSSDTALSRSSRGLDRATGRVDAGARVHLRSHDRRLAAHEPRLRQRAPQLLDAAARRLDGVDAQVRALDPARTLARGWSITRTVDGAVVRSPGDVSAGDEVVTTVATGQIRSTVTESTIAAAANAPRAAAPPTGPTESPEPDASPESTEPRP